MDKNFLFCQITKLKSWEWLNSRRCSLKLHQTLKVPLYSLVSQPSNSASRPESRWGNSMSKCLNTQQAFRSHGRWKTEVAKDGYV